MKTMDKDTFLAYWKVSRLTPLETAQALDIDPAQALHWVREHRRKAAESQQKPFPPKDPRQLVEQVLNLAAQAREWTEAHHLPGEALLAFTRLAALIPVLEEAWLALLPTEEKRESTL